VEDGWVSYFFVLFSDLGVSSIANNLNSPRRAENSNADSMSRPFLISSIVEIDGW